MQKDKKKKNIILKATIILFLAFNIIDVTVRLNNKESTATMARENVYGEFILPDSSRWIYVHPTVGLDTNTGLAPNDPVRTLTKAQQVRGNLGGFGAIMLLDNVTLSATLTINYDLVIASSPVHMDGSVNDDTFTLKRDVSMTTHLLLVNWNTELHLTNIIIDGNRPQNALGSVDGSAIWVGTGHATLQGSLYMHEGSVVKNGNRTLGGAAIALQGGLLYMNGGLVEHNYATGIYPIISSVVGSLDNKFYLISGEVSNNIGEVPPISVNFPNTAELYIGSDFVLKDNTTSTWANMLPYSIYGTHVINNFTSRKQFAVEGQLNEMLAGITIVDENFIPLIEQPKMLTFFAPANDPTLYPHYSQSNQQYFWQTLKIYNADHDIITLPTANTTGLLGRKAYIGDDIDGNPIYDANDYIDEVVLPKLDAINYTNITFNKVNNEVSYEYSHNLKIFVLRYSAPNDNYNWFVTLEPTETTTGTMILVHASFPGATFDEVVLPLLSTSNYAVTFVAPNIIFAYIDPLGVPHNFFVQQPFFGYAGTVTLMPTATTTGSADLSHPDYPGLIFGSVVLPRLNDFDYDLMINAATITYRYFHNLTGTIINLIFDIPVTGYTVQRINALPTHLSAGIATLIHSDFPDYERTVILPELSSDDYTSIIVPSGDVTVGEVVYTYFAVAIDTEITFSYPYNYADLTWEYHVSPTLTTPGSLQGTSILLPGTVFTLELPVLSAQFYDIVEGEETITYTLKDETYGIFSFVFPLPQAEPEEPEEPEQSEESEQSEAVSQPEVPNDPAAPAAEKQIWPYIVGIALVLILGVGGAVIAIRRLREKE